MAKITTKMTCDSISSNKNNSSVRFAIELPPVAPDKPGEAPKRVAKTVCQWMYTTPEEAMAFKVGKVYTLTIEG